MAQMATYTTMVVWIYWIYSLISQSPAVSSASATGVHYHSLFVIRQAVLPTILLNTRWWNPSSTFIMAPATTLDLAPIEKQLLNNCLLKYPLCLHHCPCPCQQLWHHPPLTPRLPKILIQGRQVDIVLGECEDQICKGCGSI